MDEKTGYRVLRLKEQIAQHFNSSNWQELGLLTGSSDVVTGHSRLLRSLSFGDDDYEGNIIQVLSEIVTRDQRNSSF